MSEIFNPKDEQYKEVKDLPYSERNKYRDIPEEGGGFAREEAVENFELAEKAATIIKNITGDDLKATDILLNQFIEEENGIKEERKVALKTLQEGGNVRFELETRLREDREIMMQAVKNDGANLQYASYELQRDKELVLEAVRNKNDDSKKHTYHNFKYASPLLQSNKEFVTEIMDIDPRCFIFATDNLKKDEDLALKAISSGVGLENVDDSLRRNKEFVRKAIHANVDCIRNSESFGSRGDREIDKELAIDIVSRKGELLNFLSGWRSDPEVIVAAIKNDPKSIKYVPENIKIKIISILKNN